VDEATRDETVVDEAARNGTVVAAEGVTRVYGTGDAAVRALRGVSMAFPRGQFASVMGPSGSGKSTLLHILSGLDEPTEGTVTIDGTVLNGLDDKDLTLLRRRKIGFIFQSFNLLPMLSAEENVELPLTIANEKADPKWIDEVIASVGLGDRMTHKPNELSGGQRQRVAIARALVNDPAILLADEPTGNLDVKTGDEIMALFKQLNQNGRTIVMVTHSDEIAQRARRIIRMRDGRIVSDESRN